MLAISPTKLLSPSQELSKLQDKVPAYASEKAMGILERELGAPASQLFRSFDERPIAAASLGQVCLPSLLCLLLCIEGRSHLKAVLNLRARFCAAKSSVTNWQTLQPDFHKASGVLRHQEGHVRGAGMQKIHSLLLMVLQEIA